MAPEDLEFTFVTGMIIEYIIITLMLACVGAIVSKMLADEVVRRANK